MFWSLDSRFIAFTADGKLKTIRASGGPTQSLCDAREGRGGTWSATGDIVFQPTNREPLYRVSESGGEPTPATELDVSLKDNSHRWPHFLPDGRHFLYTARAATNAETGVYVSSLDSKESKRILTAQSNAVYAPQGYLLFVRDGTLMAQRFDADRLELEQSLTPLIDGRRTRTGERLCTLFPFFRRECVGLPKRGSRLSARLVRSFGTIPGRSGSFRWLHASSPVSRWRPSGGRPTGPANRQSRYLATGPAAGDSDTLHQ